MSNTRNFIDYAMSDEGASAREALYSEIHDRVMAHIEAKKIELAGGMLTREEKECGMDYDDLKKEKKKAKKKVKKLKEELSLLEASKCDMENDDDSDYDDKKKELKKAKKKLKKLKEAMSILEGESEYEDEGNEENDEDSEDSSEDESN